MQSEKVGDVYGVTLRQEQLLNAGLALDIEIIGDPVDDSGVWELYGFMDDVEYLWGSTGLYAESIGRTDDGRYFAAPDERFRIASPGYICCWYR